MSYHIAVDIGASRGRLILVTLGNHKKLDIAEIYRFTNQLKFINRFDRCNIHYLVNQIIIGLKKVKKMVISECTIVIDTWAVDYCLVDENGELLAQPISYRDDRTKDTMKKVFNKVSKKNIYKKTGIQFQNFNT